MHTFIIVIIVILIYYGFLEVLFTNGGLVVKD